MNQPGQENILNAEVEIKGNLKFTHSLRLDGKIEGQVQSEGKFMLGPTGEVKGDVVASQVIIEGKVHGNVIASDRVELKAHAQLFGDLKASRLVIEDGVVISGKCEVNPEGRKISDLLTKANKGPEIAEFAQKR